MLMTASFVCRSLREEDEGAVRALVGSSFSGFLGGKFWDWKYLENPGFDRSWVAVAEEGGRIIGCNHWLFRSFKVSGSVVVDAALGADIAVVPEYRKKGVGRALIYFMRGQHAGRRLPLMYMFADPVLSRHFHTPVAGYVPVEHGTALYTKILNWNKVKSSASVFSQRAKAGEFGDRLSKVDLTVVFRVRGAPPLRLQVTRDGVKADVSMSGADVTVLGDVATLALIKGEGGGGMRSLVQAVLTGRLRLRGSPWKMFALYRSMWVFREVFSGKMT
jgi:predicted N-acetyltransferase YhbS